MRVLLILTVLVSACGGSPMSPTPLPPFVPPPVVLKANLTDAQTVTIAEHADGRWGLTGHAHNAGDGCAGSVAGTMRVMRVDGGEATVFDLAFPPATMVRPAEDVAYTMCCLPRDASGHNYTYSTTLTFETIPCP